MNFSRRDWKSIGNLLTLVLAVVLVVSGIRFVWAQADVGINIRIITPAPVLSINALGPDGLEAHWNWDTVSPGYVPPPVSAVLVELSTDGINYSNPQVHVPGDFEAAYTGLAAGSYIARVTVIDGNDFDYVVGPVTLVGGGRATQQPPPVMEFGDVTVAGLAYPGSSVVFNYNGGNIASISTDMDGRFSYQTLLIPVGIGTFSFAAGDPEGILSGNISFDYNVPVNTPVLISDIYLPPTISVFEQVVTQGEGLVLFGYGYKNGSVSVVFDGPVSLVVLAQVGSTGRWRVNMSSSSLIPGTYNASAESANNNGSIISPVSEIIVFELLSPSMAAGECGNSVLEAEEMCDDGNINNYDGCSSLCQLEALLPESQISQPDPSVYPLEPVTLSYSSYSPNGAVSFVELYLSRNGGVYEKYGTTFTGGLLQLTGLLDGNYEAYTIATDALGYVEPAPLTPDATFTVDRLTQLNVLAQPEKRAANNWALPANLSIYLPASTVPDYVAPANLDSLGMADITADTIPLAQGNYGFALKGLSHLTRVLPSLDFQGVDLMLDFTKGGAQYLLGGDAHSSKDDYVNGLDFSTMALALYSAMLDSDLNYDGYVNGMDLSIAVVNLFKGGEEI